MYECRLSNIRGGTITRTVSCYGIYVFARDPPPLRLKVGGRVGWRQGSTDRAPREQRAYGYLFSAYSPTPSTERPAFPDNILGTCLSHPIIVRARIRSWFVPFFSTFVITRLSIDYRNALNHGRKAQQIQARYVSLHIQIKFNCTRSISFVVAVSCHHRCKPCTPQRTSCGGVIGPSTLGHSGGLRTARSVRDLHKY